MTFTVAIVGRPNVGKSTLFNRLAGRRLALVADTPGVTRDRREGAARLGTLDFRAIDTAGLEDAAAETMQSRMLEHTAAALADADAALFLIDARAGITPVDRHFADWLRGRSTPVILVANKCESKASDGGYYEAFELGLGEPVAISAEHGEGLADLYDRLSAFGPDGMAAERGDEAADDDEERPLRLAVVGRPNVGKSTLVNTFLGQERMLTGEEAGITRDSVAVNWSWRDRPIRLFDTAGLRRHAKVTDALEELSVADALRAIRFAEVVIVLVDGTTPLEKQDRHIASLVAGEGRALVVGVNKWDLISDRDAAFKRIRAEVGRLLPQVRGVPVMPVSALTGEGTGRLIAEVFECHRRWNRRVPTAGLNRWLASALERHPPPLARGRRVKLRYITQVKARPPTFVAFCSRPSALPESYRRFLVNELRDNLDLPGIPIKILLRKGRNPYAKD